MEFVEINSQGQVFIGLVNKTRSYGQIGKRLILWKGPVKKNGSLLDLMHFWKGSCNF
jgi:hypothetical protein